MSTKDEIMGFHGGTCVDLNRIRTLAQRSSHTVSMAYDPATKKWHFYVHPLVGEKLWEFGSVKFEEGYIALIGKLSSLV